VEEKFRRCSCSSAGCIDGWSPKPCPSFVLNLNGDRGDLGDLKLGADFGPGSIISFSSSLSEVGEIASGCGVGFRPIVNGSLEILM
jgi:hypothetical protein